MKVISNSEAETIKIAKDFAKKCKAGDVILLTGDSGAGKTVFARGFVSALSGDVVTSPTFTIVNTYGGKIPIYHFDLYRINSPSELYEIGVEEYLYGDGICLVEWPERANEVFPKSSKSVRIIKKSNEKREILIK